MDIFSGINEAQVYGSGQYIQPGLHGLSVKSVGIIDSQRHPGRKFFCVEFQVVESDTHPVGSTVTWLVDMEKPSRETAFSNIKEFASALLEVTPSEVTEEVMKAMIGAAQPSASMEVKAEAWHKPTTSGGVFTRIKWYAPQAVANN